MYREKRPRKRYLVFKLYTVGASPDFEALRSSLEDYMRGFLGLSGLVDTSVKLIRYDNTTRYGVLRIVSTDIDRVLLGLARVRRLGGVSATIVPLRLTGTLSKAVKYLRELESRL